MSSTEDRQKALLTALKVLNWRAAGAAKLIQTTEAEDLDADFLGELQQSCRDAASRTEAEFDVLVTAVRQKARQTRVAEFLPLKKVYEGRVDTETGEIREEAGRDVH